MKFPKIDIHDKEVVFDGWANVTNYDVTYTSENLTARFNRTIFDSGNGAAILLVNYQTEKILLVSQLRYGIYFNTPEEAISTEVVAGIVDNDDPKATIIKEVLEEAGIQISQPQFIQTVYTSPGAHSEKLHLFFSEYTSKDRIEEGGGLDDEHEDIEVKEYTFDEVIEKYKSGYFQDAKTVLLIQWWIIMK